MFVFVFILLNVSISSVFYLQLPRDFIYVASGACCVQLPRDFIYVASGACGVQLPRDFIYVASGACYLQLPRDSIYVAYFTIKIIPIVYFQQYLPGN